MFDAARKRASRRVALRLAVLAAALVFLYAKEAWVSGSHAIRFLEPNFIYDFDEGVRKSFHSAQDSREYFDEKRERSTRVFTAALPLFTSFFQESRKHGVKFLELRLRDLDQGALQDPPIDSADKLVGKAEEVYPRAIKLDLNATNRDSYGINQLILMLERGLDRRQADWLWSRVAALRYSALASREAEIARVAAACGERFLPGVTTARIGKNFALSVGMPEEIRPENEKLWAAQAEALLIELLPVVTNAFASDELLRLFFSGDPAQLVSLEEKFGQRPQGAELAKLFNPYGPLLDSLGMRTTVQVGGLRVTLLYVVKGKWGEAPKNPQPTSAISQWLERVGAGRVKSDAAIDALIKRVEKPRDESDQRAAIDELVRQAKEPALRTVGGQRIIDYLVKHATSDPKRQDPLRKLTMENLRWIDCSDKRRAFLELAKSPQQDDLMPVISQALADIHDADAANALIAVMTDARRSESSRSWAKNGLQTMFNHLTSTPDSKNPTLKDRIKKEVDAFR